MKRGYQIYIGLYVWLMYLLTWFGTMQKKYLLMSLRYVFFSQAASLCHSSVFKSMVFCLFLRPRRLFYKHHVLLHIS